jgi:hypothetical protein
MSGDSRYIVSPINAALLPLTSFSITDEILSTGCGCTSWSSSLSCPVNHRGRNDTRHHVSFPDRTVER